VTTQANVSTRQLTGELNAAPVRASRASNPRASRASHPPPKIQEEKGFASSDSDDGFRDSDGEGGSVAKAKNEKEEESRGSIQRYVADVQGAADDFGMPNDLEAAAQVIATRDAQQVALLDLRVCNTDRHPGNLLLQKNPVKDGPRFVPIPIDHGCTLPQWWAMGEANFDAWQEWPQARAPCEAGVRESLRRICASREEALRQLQQLKIEPAAQATYRLQSQGLAARGARAPAGAVGARSRRRRVRRPLRASRR
jgi:hypothetical protein